MIKILMIEDDFMIAESSQTLLKFHGYDVEWVTNGLDGLKLLSQQQFDLVLLDPPYAKEEIIKNIEQLCQGNLLSDEVMVVCESDKSVDLREEIADLGIWKQKVYGISKVTVYVR